MLSGGRIKVEYEELLEVARAARVAAGEVRGKDPAELMAGAAAGIPGVTGASVLRTVGAGFSAKLSDWVESAESLNNALVATVAMLDEDERIRASANAAVTVPGTSR